MEAMHEDPTRVFSSEDRKPEQPVQLAEQMGLSGQAG